MKKSNSFGLKLMVLVLALVLLVVCISSSSFSWFARPQSGSGNSLKFNYLLSGESGMVAYDGSGITMKHEISTDDGLHFTALADNDAMNPENPISNKPIPVGTTNTTTGYMEGNRIYYKTTLTNNNNSPQNVSLYIKDFNTGDSGSVCVGVNEPIKAFKNYSYLGDPKPAPSKTSTAGPTTKRIYYETYSGRTNSWYRTDKNPLIYYGNGNTNSNKELTWIKDGTGTKMFYVDVPSNTTQCYFTVGNDWNNTNYKRSQTFTDLTGDGLSRTQSLLFKVQDWYDQTYNNCHLDVEQTGGAYLNEYYNTAQLGVGDTLDLSLGQGQYGYSVGNRVSYSVVSGGSYITLDTTTGVVTGRAAGTAKIKYTIRSQHYNAISSSQKDVITAECTITVKDYAAAANTIANAPIVTNLLIPGKSSITEQKPYANVQDVYWFIQNGDEMYGAATAEAKYSHSGIYLGL